MATSSELAQIQHILGKRRSADHNPLDLSARKKSREYLDSHKDVEKRRRDRINTCLETIRTLVPLCSQLPRHRRVDKADLLDLAIIYLRMVNKFLEKIGITDIFSAAHQQVNLFSSLEKWVRHQGENFTDVPTFTKEILSVLEREMETASHVIASQQTSGSDTNMTPKDDVDWMKNEHTHLDDEPGSPRSCQPLSGSDEESLVSSNGEREGRTSGSDDSVPSPNYPPSKTDLMRKCHFSCSTEEPYGVYQNGYGSCSCPSTRSAMSNGYSMHYEDSCNALSKPQCADKAVNTDASSMNFTWPPDSTFTLPILAGKIVLHTPAGTNGTNNLNAPVTLHAEIHSSPNTNPQQLCKQPAGPQHGDGNFKTEMFLGTPSCDRGTDPHMSIPVSMSEEQNHYSTSHVSIAKAALHPSSIYPKDAPTERPVTMNTPPPSSFAERNCLRGHRRGTSAYTEDVHQDQRCEKSYGSFIPKHFLDERDLVCSGGDRRDFPDVRKCPDVCYTGNGQGEIPFSKRFLSGIGHHQKENNMNNNNNSHKSQFSDRFPTASSSLKMKSLMVHRHQSQHVLS